VTEQGYWHHPHFFRLAWTTLLFIYLTGTIIFLLVRQNQKWIGAWASIKSWMLAAPFLFAVGAAPAPWPFLFFVMVCIYGSKTFFRMTGMYHRSWFVWLSYFGIFSQAYLTFTLNDRFFNVAPMFFFAASVLIPIFRNSSTHMIQYVALSLMNFIFFGWGLMHLGRIVMWSDGLLIALHLAILSEFSNAAQHFGNRLFGHTRPIANVSTRFTVEGYLFAVPLTLFLAFGLRGLLPGREEVFWLSTGLTILIFGRLGAFTMSFIRKDLGIKESGVFIIGRDDLLSRLDGLIFSAPAAFYLILIATGQFK